MAFNYENFEDKTGQPDADLNEGQDAGTEGEGGEEQDEISRLAGLSEIDTLKAQIKQLQGQLGSVGKPAEEKEEPEFDMDPEEMKLKFDENPKDVLNKFMDSKIGGALKKTVQPLQKTLDSLSSKLVEIEFAYKHPHYYDVKDTMEAIADANPEVLKQADGLEKIYQAALKKKGVTTNQGFSKPTGASLPSEKGDKEDSAMFEAAKALKEKKTIYG